MIINCDLPDLLLCYSPGAAGRLLCYLVMLSPEMHTWSDELEAELTDLPDCQHANIKLNYIKNHIFPIKLKTDIRKWKTFEPNPFGLSFNKTKKFIRHAWMKPGMQDLVKFETKKIVYVDYSECMYFILRAVISKNTYGLSSPRLDLPSDEWYKSDSEETTRKIIVDQMIEMDQILAMWKKEKTAYELPLHKLLFSGNDSFRLEYTKLCNYYEITPLLIEGADLLNHWLSLQWQRN